MIRKLQKSYYQQADTLGLARDLLGKVLCFQNPEGENHRAVITETEAYLGAEDRASHAWGNRLTPRTQTMFEAGGVAYIYLCYGIHHLFNIVTHQFGTPHAVLIRGGILMTPSGASQGYNNPGINSRVLGGPGIFTKKMGITIRYNGISLTGNTLWLEDHQFQVKEIKTSPRIGVDYAGDDALLPYRFQWENPHLCI
ncbi:MAG: DNA-3-methyladenine glycosylase [Bacteroidales bacterium]